jgi:methyl-accepting chemotaxis protein
MTIRAKLYTAIVVVVAGLAMTVGVAAWAMNELGGRFDDVQRAADSRALALRLKFDVTDFNGWQTAYGYDDGESRPVYLTAFARFQRDLALAQQALESPNESALLDRIGDAADDFDRLDAVAWSALQAGRTEQVRRIFLGPEIANFRRAASAAQRLAVLEDANAAAQERAFEDAKDDALRLLVGAGIVAALLVIILLLTATDLARQAERTLESNGGDRPSPDV